MEEVIGKIRAVLISNKGKSDLREMQKDYKMLMGEDIPYKKLGYSSLESFVKSAQSLNVTQGPNGVIFIEAAVTNSSKHMVQLINKQKTSKKKSGGSGRLPARYQSSKVSGYIPRFQNQPKSKNQSNQQWRAQYLDNARPKSHVHQIVVSVDGSSSGAQQRLVKSVALSQSSPTHTNHFTDSSSRKIPLKVTTNQTSTFNTPQISLINNLIKNDSRPRMRSHNNYTPMPSSQPNTYFGTRPAAPTLSEDAIKALIEKHDRPKPNRNQQLMKEKSVPDIVTKKGNIATTPNTNTNTNTNKKSNSTVLNGDKMGPLEKLEAFTRSHGLSEPVVKTMHMSKAGRSHICSIKIDNETFSSYPRDCSTVEDAETEAVNKAFATLLKRFSIHERSLLISTENDVLTRIPPIIECHFSGVWAEQIASDYRDKYSEQLPPNWLALLDTLPTISVEPALNDRYVLKMCKCGEKNAQRSTLSSSLELSSDVSVPSNKLLLVPDGWLVEVTYVASTIEVWCRRVDTDDANAYCDMAKDLQSYYNGASAKEHATNVAPGGFYVVAFDGCWSRVRVLNTGEHDVTCFFIDYGDEHVVPKSDMYILKREFAREQAQAFVCRLSGLEELANMSAASNRLEQLAGQTYLAKPQMHDDVLGPSAISITLYDVNIETNEIGENVNVRLINGITADAVPTLDPHNINHVYVTHTTNKGDIYVQCHSEAYNKLNELIAALDTIDLGAEFKGANIPSKGSAEATAEYDAKTLYLARWTQQGGDGNLYRAKITDRSPCGQYICLYFIDFGNSQIIPITDTEHLYKLDKISDVLCAFPPLAIRVTLDLDLDLDRANVTTSAKRIMDLLPTDKPVLLKIVRMSEDPDGIPVPICEIFRRSESHNELFSVNASLKYIDTNLDEEDTNNNDKTMMQLVKKLERLKSVSEQMDNNKAVPSTGILASPYLPEPSEFFDVRIPFAVNPWNFFVQPYAMATQLKDLMKQLQQRYNNIRTDQLQLEDVVPGKIYASKYNNGKWYRTSVIKVINSGSISVFYCDFGYYANLTVKQLVPLDAAFLELPYQAIKARLAGIQPRDAKWSMDDCKYFEKLVHEKTFVSVVVAVQQDELYQCDSVLILRLIDTSTDNDIYIDKLLVNEGIAAAQKK